VRHNGIQRPQSTSATVGGSTIWSQTRTYDNVGNVLQLATTVPSIGGGTLTENQSFCYDAVSRLVWAGNSGTPTGGDHCGNTPSGTTLPTYQQAFSYDSLDRMASGPAGSVTYGDINHVHAATSLGNMPNPYAGYDAMGNMTCRNTDTTSGHTCGSSPTGALMSYDNEGRLASWTAPSGTTASDSFLYDNEGNRVLQRVNTGTVTDTITFDGYSETVLTGGTITPTKYYNVNGQRVAMKTNSTLSYLLSDELGSSTIALTSSGSTQAMQLFAPYGAIRYSQGTMPTTYNFTGQRLDSQTGLLYYNSRYYDPISGRFVMADTVDNNESGMDPYAYVAGNPETKNDPSGHGDPFLQYIASWYASIHQGNDVYSDAYPTPPGVRGRMTILNPANPTSLRGRGYPDIANRNLGLIWEVKSSGTMFTPGRDFPNPAYVARGVAKANLYARNASTMATLGVTSWNVGTTTGLPGSPGYDAALANYFRTDPNCNGGVCTLYFQDNLVMEIRIEANGVLGYRVIRQRTTPDPIPVLVTVTSAYLLAKLYQYLRGRQQPGPVPGPVPGPALHPWPAILSNLNGLNYW
jgi:RHS repeat-associated protein